MLLNRLHPYKHNIDIVWRTVHKNTKTGIFNIGLYMRGTKNVLDYEKREKYYHHQPYIDVSFRIYYHY